MRVLTAAFMGLLGSAASAETFTVPIDPSQSTVTATLTLLSGTSSDTSPVTGFVQMKLDTVNNPVQVTGLNYDLLLTEQLNFFINYGFGSTFTSTVTGLRLLYAMPGTPIGPVPIVMGGFSFIGVPTNAEGVLTYTATGLVCIALQGSNLPCTDTDDLSTEPTQNVDFEATIAVGPGRLVTVVSSVDRTVPIDPNNPGLGTLRVHGTIRGSVVVPVIPGDANGDCIVDFSDVTSVLANFNNVCP